MSHVLGYLKSGPGTYIESFQPPKLVGNMPGDRCILFVGQPVPASAFSTKEVPAALLARGRT